MGWLGMERSLGPNSKGNSVAALFRTLRFYQSSPHGRYRKQAEHNPDSVRFQFNLLFASLALQVIECDVRRLVAMRVTMSNPCHIFDELGGSDSREADPQPTFVNRKHAAAPAQNLFRLVA